MALLRRFRSSPLARRTGVVVASLAVALAGCGDDGAEDRPASPVALDDLAESSGGAPAVGGVDLPEPPGATRRTGLPGVGETAASITAADGTVSGCCLLVADTVEQRQRGLMEVTDLGGYDGMVFVWDTDVESGFWMRNTPTPLSIAWFDADGDFVSDTDMEPCPDRDDCPMYPPAGPYRFAIEVFRGDLDALGVGPGSRLTLGGTCAGGAAAD
ncbi:MAG TPA: DUF192 domain-containing protein [Acidimicrobiales bacterium]